MNYIILSQFSLSLSFSQQNIIFHHSFVCWVTRNLPKNSSKSFGVLVRYVMNDPALFLGAKTNGWSFIMKIKEIQCSLLTPFFYIVYINSQVIYFNVLVFVAIIYALIRKASLLLWNSNNELVVWAWGCKY